MKQRKPHSIWTRWTLWVLALSFILPSPRVWLDSGNRLHIEFAQALAQPGQCGGSCGGGQGGQGGGGGGNAAEVLLGVAAILAPIMAAVAQTSAAKEKAKADKYIAKTSADAAIRQTQIQSATTRELAENQKVVAAANTRATVELAQRQQDASTQRLVMQLQALEKEREKASSERAEIRRIEEKRSNQQIAFAKEQSDQNLKLAKLTMFNQLVQNSLTPGSTTSQLGVSPITSSRGEQVSGGGSPLSTALGVSSSTRRPGLRPAIVKPGNGRAVTSQAVSANRRGVTKKTQTSELLVSALKKEDEEIEALRAVKRKRRGTPSRGFGMSPSLGGATTVMSQSYVYGRSGSRGVLKTGRLVSGSTRVLRHRDDVKRAAKAGSRPSGIQQFSKAVAKNASHSFTEYLENERPNISGGARRGAKPTTGHGAKPKPYGGYNAPAKAESRSRGRSRGRYLVD